MNIYKVKIAPDVYTKQEYEVSFMDVEFTLTADSFESASKAAKKKGYEGVPALLEKNDHGHNGREFNKWFDVTVRGVVTSIELIGLYGGKAKPSS